MDSPTEALNIERFPHDASERRSGDLGDNKISVIFVVGLQIGSRLEMANEFFTRMNDMRHDGETDYYIPYYYRDVLANPLLVK